VSDGFKRWLPRLLGLGVGVFVAVGGVLAARVPAGDGTLGMDVRVMTAPSLGLSFSPGELVFVAPQLRPGKAGRTGALDVTNRSATRVLVRTRAQPSTDAVEDLLWLEIDDGGGVVFKGPLAQLRDWTQTAAMFGPAEDRTLRVTAWLPDVGRGGYAGLTADVTLEWKTEQVGS
jgi:hypothetical protein